MCPRSRRGGYDGGLRSHMGPMHSVFDVIIVGGGAPASAPRGGSRRGRVGRAAGGVVAPRGPRPYAGSRRVSPRSRLRMAPFGRPQRLGRHRRGGGLPGGPGRSALGQGPSQHRAGPGRPGGGPAGVRRVGGPAPRRRGGQRPGRRRPGARRPLQRLCAVHRRLHERRRARGDLRHRLPRLRRRLDGPELAPAPRLRDAGRRQPAGRHGPAPRHPRRGDRPDGGRGRRHHARRHPPRRGRHPDGLDRDPGRRRDPSARRDRPLARGRRRPAARPQREGVPRDRARLGVRAGFACLRRHPRCAVGRLFHPAQRMAGDRGVPRGRGRPHGGGGGPGRRLRVRRGTARRPVRPRRGLGDPAAGGDRVEPDGHHRRGVYSCALPGRSGARAQLARPFEERLFFAGEATHPHDFTTAHGPTTAGRGPPTRPWRRSGRAARSARR